VQTVSFQPNVDVIRVEVPGPSTVALPGGLNVRPLAIARVKSARAEADGGESGIRTHGRVSPTHAFQACSFNHSDISPCL
jgi:hypothetical protein